MLVVVPAQYDSGASQETLETLDFERGIPNAAEAATATVDAAAAAKCET